MLLNIFYIMLYVINKLNIIYNILTYLDIYNNKDEYREEEEEKEKDKEEEEEGEEEKE